MLAFHHFTMATAELFFLAYYREWRGGKKILQPNWYTVVWHTSVNIM